jgi:hypothetical protein
LVVHNQTFGVSERLDMAGLNDLSLPADQLVSSAELHGQSLHIQNEQGIADEGPFGKMSVGFPWRTRNQTHSDARRQITSL